MLKNRLICCMLLFITAVSFFGASAQTDDVLARFTIEERNGTAVEKFLAKRGIPLQSGVLAQNDEIYVVNDDTGEIWPSQSRVLETYESGSVKWILVSVAADLKPNEKKSFAVKKGSASIKSNMNYREENGIIYVDNGVVSASFGGSGIRSLEYCGKNILSGKAAASSCVQNNNEYSMINGTAEIIDSGDVFVKIKVSAPYGESAMRTEQTYTITSGSGRIGCTNAYISYNGTYPNGETGGVDYINSLYESFYLDNGFDSIEFGEGEASQKTGMKSTGYMCAYNDKSDASFALVSKDIEKFRGAAAYDICNGFAVKNGAVIYAPILYSANFGWQEGMSRTTHCDIILQNGKNTALQAALETQKTTPAVNVEKEAFIKTGILKSDKISSLAKAQIEEIKWTKNRRNGRRDAGNIPFAVDSESGTTGMYNVHLGEIEYNTWYGAIASQDADLFDIVNESTECWADTMIYKGVVKEARGLGRYRVDFTANGESSHAYYSEFSNLYMGYLMTGEEYYREQCYSMADVMYRIASAASEMSGHMAPHISTWCAGAASVNKAYDRLEIRNAFQIRSMYNAYNLFKEPRFAEFAAEIGRWTDAVQDEDGSWAQELGESGERLKGIKNGQRTWVMYKNYIMLYTLRGHCDYYKQTKSEEVFPQIQRFADYLLNELGDNDWIWDPCGDKEKCETGEDYSRGKSPMQEMMASEIFETVYEATGDKKYFEGLCRVLSNYIASAAKSGFVAQRYNAEEYLDGAVNSIITGQNTTLLHMDSAYCGLFDKNRELAKKLGYEGLVAIFADGADYLPGQITNEYNYLEVGANLYGGDSGRYLYVSNNSGFVSKNWDKNIKLQIAGRASLWTNMKCSFENIYETTVDKELEMFGYVYSKELPVQASALTDTVEASAETYSDKEIVFNVSGDNGKAVFLIKDGDFPIDAGEGYTVSISGGKEKQVRITTGGDTRAAKDGLYIELDFNKDNVAVFDDIIEHWSRNDVEVMYAKGFVKGVSKRLFAPEQTVTRRQAIYFIMRTLGVDETEAEQAAVEQNIVSENEDLSLPASREDIINYCMRAIRVKRGEIKSDKISTECYYLVENIEDDRIAIQTEAELLDFDSMELTKNIVLPISGRYGTTISWSGGNEYLTADGRVTQPTGAQGDMKAQLTAEISRGNEKTAKTFEFTVKDASNVYYVSGGFSDGIIPVEKITGEFSFEMDATPMASGCNWVIGMFDEKTLPSDYPQLGLIVRFNPQGTIDAYSGNAYKAESDIKYNAGEKYTFKISGDVNRGTYSVQVIGENGEQWQLAENYAYRASAGINGNFGGLTSVTASGYGVISRLTIAAVKESKLPFGYVNGDDYFGITRGSVDVEHKDNLMYFSTAADCMDSTGKYLKAPEKNIYAYIIGVDESVDIFEDFNAADSSSYDNILTAQVIGMINGDENNMLRPRDICTRAEAMSIIRRFYDLSNVKIIAS